MSIEELGSFGEFVGSAAVVITLIYLAIQIRSTNRETRAATIQSALKSEMDNAAVLAQHAATWDKVLKGADLADGEEIRTGIVLYNLIMTEAESRYYQFRSGYLDTQSWEGRHASLRELVALPIYEIWKGSPGALNHSADFSELLEHTVRSPKR